MTFILNRNCQFFLILLMNGYDNLIFTGATIVFVVCSLD